MSRIDPAALDEAALDELEAPLERRRRRSGGRAGRRERRGALIPVDVDPARCPHPEKIAYRTKAAAKAKIPRLRRADLDGLAAYRCACGFWHLGHSSWRAA